MTRKRAVKLLMARGYSRNHANGLMRLKVPGDSNFQAYKTYLRCEKIFDSVDRLPICCYDYGISASILVEAICSFGESLAGR
nr:MAG TPA: hypothetical protein [Caudoviricetes sp.]